MYACWQWYKSVIQRGLLSRESDTVCECHFWAWCLQYSASSVIRTPSVRVDLRSVQISEFVRVSEIHLCRPFSLRILRL